MARAGQIDYALAFNLIRYLYSETDYFPWYAALKGFDFLMDVYGEDSDVGKRIIEFQYYLLQGVYKEVWSTSALNASDQIHTLRLDLILGRLCKLGREDCVEEAKRLYQAYRSGAKYVNIECGFDFYAVVKISLDNIFQHNNNIYTFISNRFLPNHRKYKKGCKIFTYLNIIY